MPDADAPVIGIDLGGTNFQVGLVDAEGAIVARAGNKTLADRGAPGVIDRIAALVRDVCREAGIHPSAVAALGVGAPGAIDAEAGVVLEAPNLCWNDVPLAAMLAERLNDLHVTIENDVNAAVYGENRLGAGHNAPDVLGIWVGTGIGGGLIMNSRLYHGGFGTAGEIGHTLLFPTAPLGQRKLEEVCSRKSIERRIRQLIESNHPSILADIEPGAIGITEIAAAYREHDLLVRQVVDEAADLLGRAIANAVSLLGFPLILLGGGLAESLGDAYRARVEQSAQDHVFPRRCAELRVVTTTLAENAGLLGAAMLARERFHPTHPHHQ